MNDLIQVIKILDDKQLKEVNSGIDDLEFIPSSVGFHDGDTGEPRVDNNIRTSSNAFLPEEGNEARDILHEGMNKALLEYRDRLIGINPIFDGYPVPGGFMTTSHREDIQVLEYESSSTKRWASYENFSVRLEYTLKETINRCDESLTASASPDTHIKVSVKKTFKSNFLKRS